MYSLGYRRGEHRSSVSILLRTYCPGQTGLFEDLDILKAELLESTNQFEEWKTRVKIESCLIAIYLTKVGDIDECIL